MTSRRTMRQMRATHAREGSWVSVDDDAAGDVFRVFRTGALSKRDTMPRCSPAS
jgi:hypothetical protein